MRRLPQGASTIRSLADRRLWQEEGLRGLEIAASPSEPVCLLLGAGASVPHLPTAWELNREILATIVDDRLRNEFDLAKLEQCAGRSHMTLEVFCSMLRYRCGRRFDVVRLWDAICCDVEVSPLARCIAPLRRSGWCGAILTTNFDRMIPDALGNQPFRMLTELQLRLDTEPDDRDVCALHGTTFGLLSPGDPAFAPPLSATARGLARPYPPVLDGYLTKLFSSGRKLLVIGHSGRDYYDINPLLAEMRARSPQLLENWLWLSHLGRAEEVQRLGELVGPENVIRADATRVLEQVCDRLGLTRSCAPPREGAAGWRQRLRATIASFELEAEEVREFLRDLERNLPGAWVVQEHYRLYSAGYGEGDTLTFGGVALRGPEEAFASDLSHLDFLQGPCKVEFGELLRGQFAYRFDDRHYAAGAAAAADSSYTKATRLLTETAERIDEVLTSPAENALRAEDRALLLVGKAIAVDYLGLIHRKRGRSLAGKEGRREVQEALSCFRACIDLARQARAELEPVLRAARKNTNTRSALEDLVQYWVWELIGKDNVARCLLGAEAIAAFEEAIGSRRSQMARERRRARREKALSTMNDYLIAHLPQLWLRASELVKCHLEAMDDTAIPLPWDAVPEEGRREIAINLRRCRNAYTNFEKLSLRPHGHFPALFEVEILVLAARAFAAGTHGERTKALRKLETVYARFAAVARANPDLSKTWVGNVHERVERIRAKLAETPEAAGQRRSSLP
jgi:hypothetical protein